MSRMKSPTTPAEAEVADDPLARAVDASDDVFSAARRLVLCVDSILPRVEPELGDVLTQSLARLLSGVAAQCDAISVLAADPDLGDDTDEPHRLQGRRAGAKRLAVALT